MSWLGFLVGSGRAPLNVGAVTEVFHICGAPAAAADVVPANLHAQAHLPTKTTGAVRRPAACAPTLDAKPPTTTRAAPARTPVKAHGGPRTSASKSRSARRLRSGSGKRPTMLANQASEVPHPSNSCCTRSARAQASLSRAACLLEGAPVTGTQTGRTLTSMGPDALLGSLPSWHAHRKSENSHEQLQTH